MLNVNSVTCKIDHLTFDLLSCINELQSLQGQLTGQDIEQIRHIYQKLHDLLNYSNTALYEIVEAI